MEHGPTGGLSSSGAWTHRRALFKGEPEELVRLFHRDRIRQEALEKDGHCSPKWAVLRSLQQVYGAKKVRGCTIIDAPPFFESAGREESSQQAGLDTGREGSPQAQGADDSNIFWGDNQGPVVMVWDGMLPGDQESAKKMTGSYGGLNPSEVNQESGLGRIGTVS